VFQCLSLLSLPKILKQNSTTMTWGGLGLPEREYYLQPMQNGRNAY
jgi:hypothetical protein